MRGQKPFLYFIPAAAIMQFWDFNSILIEIKVKTGKFISIIKIKAQDQNYVKF